MDGQKPVKAISLASNPTKEGEKLGKLLLEVFRGMKAIVKKIKVFYDKFKGFILASALGVLTIIEMYGGYIDELFHGKLSIGDVQLLPIVTLTASIVVGCISNGFTKEQWEKVKALFTKSTTDEMVIKQIKESLKEHRAKLAQLNKDKSALEVELDNLKTQATNAQNTLEAKRKLLSMSLVTEEVVNEALESVAKIRSAIIEKQNEIDDITQSIIELNTTISALQSHL